MTRGTSRGEAARVEDRPGNRRRRRWARLLESNRRGLSRHTAPAVLGAQDGERVEQGRAVGTGEHEEGLARSLLGPEPSFGRGGDRCLRREIRGEVRQGGRMSNKGSRNNAGLLRLPRRALGSLEDDQSHRKRVCNGSPQDLSL